MKRVAIVGAGLSGLSAGLRLQEGGVDISIFDKSRGVSGRAATRSKGDLNFDHGAQVFEKGSDTVKALIDSLAIDGLQKIEKPVWTFDIMDEIREGDRLKNDKERWTIDGGIKHLGKSIEAKLSQAVFKNEQVNYIQRDKDQWAIHTSAAVHDKFDLVLFSIPAPQAAHIIERSGLDRSWRDWLCISLRTAIYRSIISLTLFWDEDLIDEVPYSALINVDRLHPVTWIGLEHLKGKRSPKNGTLLVCQMSPEWSTLHFRKDKASLESELLGYLGELFKIEIPKPSFVDKQGWLYAIPDTLADKEELKSLSKEGLYFAGDSYVGGRIHLAMESGLQVADDILQSL